MRKRHSGCGRVRLRFSGVAFANAPPCAATSVPEGNVLQAAFVSSFAAWLKAIHGDRRLSAPRRRVGTSGWYRPCRPCSSRSHARPCSRACSVARLRRAYNFRNDAVQGAVGAQTRSQGQCSLRHSPKALRQFLVALVFKRLMALLADKLVRHARAMSPGDTTRRCHRPHSVAWRGA